MVRICLDCGRRFHPRRREGRCPSCAAPLVAQENARRDASRKARGKRRGSTTAYRKARAAALKRDGYRCTWVDEYGRCQAVRNLEAHHVNGDQSDHRIDNLATYCRWHHDEVERGKV